MNILQDIVDEILSRLPAKSLMRFKVVCKDWYVNIQSPSFIAKHTKNAGKKEAMNMVLDEILSRLPVESLARFKMVSKDWYSNIHSHGFITKHIKNQATKNKLLIYHQIYVQDRRFTFSICSEKEKKDSDHVDGLTFFHQYVNHDPLLDQWKYNQVEIIGTCNGLVCLDYFKDSEFTYEAPNRFLSLWNPATRDFKTLPKFLPGLPPPLGTTRYGDDVGFGFDRANNDYKVIRILYFQKIGQLSSELEEYVVKMGIYSLSTNSWREFDCPGFSTEIIGPSTRSGAIFGEEKFCWLVRDSSTKEGVLLSFDMGKEVFQKTPLPSDYVHSEERCYTDLFTLHDYIALVHHSGKHKAYAIWTTKELEQEGNSWIKLSNVGYHPRIGRALGFWKCKNSNNFLCLFNPHDRHDRYGIKGVYMDKRDQIKTGRFMKIKFNYDSIYLPIKVLTYIETLVPVNRDNVKYSMRLV